MGSRARPSLATGTESGTGSEFGVYCGAMNSARSLSPSTIRRHAEKRFARAVAGAVRILARRAPGAVPHGQGTGADAAYFLDLAPSRASFGARLSMLRRAVRILRSLPR